jgi:hypothetical protein
LATPDLLRDAYLALRAWVWKALDQRRRDPDLRAWNDILGAAATLMAQHGQPSLGERMAVLHELLSESIAVGETLRALDITRRQHVAEASPNSSRCGDFARGLYVENDLPFRRYQSAFQHHVRVSRIRKRKDCAYAGF